MKPNPTRKISHIKLFLEKRTKEVDIKYKLYKNKLNKHIKENQKGLL